MGNGKTLILIDGHALAFRQYYALERTNMKTTDGVPSWAVYGFFKAIFDLLMQLQWHLMSAIKLSVLKSTPNINQIAVQCLIR